MKPIHEKRDTDVVIVGAGPAGIAAAKRLAESGAKTVLIDRKKRPGSKACAGGLTPEAWALAGLDPSRPNEGAQVFDRITVKTGLGSFALCGVGPLLITIDRGSWVAQRIELLKDLGVEVSLEERFMDFSQSSVTTDKEKRSCGYLIGADGASSRVRKLLRMPRSLTMRAWQMRIKASLARKCDIDTETPTIWFDAELIGSGYCWAFPHFEEMRIGLGASTAALGPKDIKGAFFKWLDRLGLDGSSGSVETGSIGCGYLGHRFGAVFLAGDAAGLASPLTGEGMAQALISGEETAKEILSSDYRSEALARLAGEHRRTHDFLLNRSLRAPLFWLAPGLLRIPFIKHATLDRYIKKRALSAY